MNPSESRLQACEQAGRALALAGKSGDPGLHSEILHNQVSTRARSILAQHPERTFTKAQEEALCELLASALLMNSLAAKPAERWIGAFLKDFKSQRPIQQLGTIALVGTVITVIAGASSLAWSYAPPAMRWAASAVLELTPAPKATEATEAKTEPSQQPPKQ